MNGIKIFGAAAGLSVAAPLLAAAVTREHAAKPGDHTRFENARTATYAEMGLGAVALTGALLLKKDPHLAAIGAGLLAGGFVANRIAGGAVHVIDNVG